MIEPTKCLVGTNRHSGDRLVIITGTEEALIRHQEEHNDVLAQHWKKVKICNHPYKEKRHAQDRPNPHA